MTADRGQSVHQAHIYVLCVSAEFDRNMDTGKEVLFALPLKVSQWLPLRPSCLRWSSLPPVLFQHRHFGPHEEEKVQSDRWKHRPRCRRDRLSSLGSLEGMKVDNIKFKKIVSSSPLVVLASGRLRFLNLGCDTGHLSFEMSCTFTVQVLAQLDLLRKVTSIKAFKNDV